MKVWKDKEGKWISFREFLTRWKNGIQAVTPLEQTRTQLLFSFIMIIGLLCGIVVSIIGWNKLWWVFIILIAGLGNASIQTLAIYQKYLALKKVEEIMKGGTENEQERIC